MRRLNILSFQMALALRYLNMLALDKHGRHVLSFCAVSDNAVWQRQCDEFVDAIAVAPSGDHVAAAIYDLQYQVTK